MSEKQIENMILNWLSWKDIYAWKVKTTGTWNEKRKRFLKPSPLYRTGIADILGILPDGKLLAIEVKSAKGRLQENQKIFLREIRDRGGVAMVARSLEDVEIGLSEYILGGSIAGNHALTQPR